MQVDKEAYWLSRPGNKDQISTLLFLHNGVPSDSHTGDSDLPTILSIIGQGCALSVDHGGAV